MPTEGHWIISMLFFSDTCQEFIKKEAINSQSDNIFLNLTIRLALELTKSVKALYSIYCSEIISNTTTSMLLTT